MSGRIAEGDWIPLMEYAVEKGVSLSTLRRHIKSNKVPYRVEEGRYLLFIERPDGAPNNVNEVDIPRRVHLHAGAQSALINPESSALRSTLQRLQNDLQKAQEEIAELKMLVALYEEQIPQREIDH